ncbi:nicotinamide riboside transporter PnuC [Thiomicrorhabdus aquaedulcis]|uniref:nicotinamide riboside transporter PnuC n=1 Tax=Thiomicrorhabdus aquaedulcis TaxID=2211106 RepID=UPI000FDAC54E|nr:nicotinamide riboside transporter PnuC [Thiomicrorhabdus aquaedulcis]
MLATDGVFNNLLATLAAQSGWEWLAAGLGILYVILAAKESIWCWPAAFISTAIYTWLFWSGLLPMQALLNAYYLIMAVYGFIIWRGHKPRTANSPLPQASVTSLQSPPAQTNLVISTRSWPFHVAFVCVGVLLSVGIGGYLATFENVRLPYLDATVTVFSVMNTVLMARKVLENWLYWIIIDSAAIALYWQTGYYVTIVMFSVYLALAVYGYLHWKNLYKKHSKTN